MKYVLKTTKSLRMQKLFQAQLAINLIAPI